jgi:hypothetical protein
VDITPRRLVRYLAAIIVIVVFPTADPLQAQEGMDGPSVAGGELRVERHLGQMEPRLTGKTSSPIPSLNAVFYSVGRRIPIR